MEKKNALRLQSAARLWRGEMFFRDIAVLHQEVMVFMDRVQRGIQEGFPDKVTPNQELED